MISASISVRSDAAYAASAFSKRLMGPAKRGNRCGALSMHTCCWLWMRSRKPPAGLSTAGTSRGWWLSTSPPSSAMLRLARFIMVVLGLLCAAATNAFAADCVTCHEQGQKLEKSAHKPVACATCHQEHNEYPHPAG